MIDSKKYIDLKKLFTAFLQRNEPRCFLIAVLVGIISFPVNDWVFGIGLDSSLSWASNHLIDTHWKNASSIIFPHGPLAVILYPHPQNAKLTICFHLLITFGLVYNLSQLWQTILTTQKWLVVLVSAYLILIMTELSNTVPILILICYVNAHQTEQKKFKVMAFVLTAVGCYIKAYTAALSLLLFFLFLIVSLYYKRNLKSILKDTAIVFVLLYSVWFILFSQFSQFFTYFYGLLQLSNDNSSAVSFYPSNNWLALSVFFAALLVLIRLSGKRAGYFIWILIIPSLFAAWKYGISREDYSHFKGFYVYYLSCLIIFFIQTPTLRLREITIAFISILTLYLNMSRSVAAAKPSYELLGGVLSFTDFMSDRAQLKSKAKLQSEQNISSQQLDSTLVKLIGKRKVDTYPWEYSFFPANQINWQPRCVLQSYAAYTSWLDEQNSQHFKSKSAPDFIIWSKGESSQQNNSFFNSIDERYLLNDEPKTLLSLFQNYYQLPNYSNPYVLKKRTKPITLQQTYSEKNTLTWFKWIPLPALKGDWLRARLNIGSGLMRTLKKTFYKDEPFWIILHLKNGKTIKHRFIPKNAVDGLWIHPYFTQPKLAEEVDKIMFMCSNQWLMPTTFELEWEHLKILNEPKSEPNLLSYDQTPNIIFKTQLTQEDSLTNQIPINNSSSETTSKKKKQSLKAGEYSTAFSIKVDSLKTSDLKQVYASCWVKTEQPQTANDVALIISVDSPTGNIGWYGTSLQNHLLDGNKWALMTLQLANNQLQPGNTINVYVWNNSNNSILINDFNIHFQK